MITIKFKQLTDEKNGYGMPKVLAVSDKNIKIINRGWNVFECTEQIDESDLRQLFNLLPGIDTAYLWIKTPERETGCWYDLKHPKESKNIIW